MTLLRYIFGTIWVLFVWLVVAVVVGINMVLIFPPSGGGYVVVGIGMDWRTIPGTILGFFAARQSWGTHVRRSTAKPTAEKPATPNLGSLVGFTRTRMNSSSQMLEPIRLQHCLQGWPPSGPNAFRWHSGRLTYMRDCGGYKTITPTTAQWEEFWRVCDEIDVWSWPPTLGDMHVIDGLQWITELEVGSRRVASTGQVHGSPPDFQARLMRLHRALQAMAGWHTPTKDY